MDPPTISRSGQPIDYALPANNPNISYGAPSLDNIAAEKKCKITSSKVPIRKTHQSSSCQAVTIASALATDTPTYIPSSPWAGNHFSD